MDYNLFLLVNNLAGKWICLDSLAIFFAKYLIYLILAGAVVAFFLIKNKKERIKYLFFTGASIFLSRIVFTELIRLIWHRPRPFLINHVHLLIEHSTSGSFPSGHITFLFALSAAVYCFNKKFGVAMLIASFIVGISRIFVGVHWPLDILGGIIIGILSAVIVKLIMKRKARLRPSGFGEARR